LLISRPGQHQDHSPLVVEIAGVRYRLVAEPSRVALREEPFPELAPLSPREIEIIRLVARGHTNAAAAAVLNISPWTVGTHLRRIFDKLGVHSRAAMIARLAPTSVLRELDAAPDVGTLLNGETTDSRVRGRNRSDRGLPLADGP